jgi:hypothetical protein
MFWKSLLAALAVSTASGWSYAQCSNCPGDGPIKVKVGALGGSTSLVSCHSAGSNLSVSVTGLSGDVLIHIYDCATPSRTSDIGVVTITGSSSNLTSIAIMVAGPTQTWDEFGESPLNEGCVDFGGLVVSESGMRALTRAAVAVSGNVEHNTSGNTPDIHVNQIVRLQAEVTGGTIAANVTADGGALFGFGNTLAIGQVRAHKGVTGKLVATDKDIANVRVVGASSGDPTGIQGDITATAGSILEVWTSGPVGSSTNTVTITAGNRIGRITCRNDGTTGDNSVLDELFYANVNAHAQAGTDGSQLMPSLMLLETGGDFVGDIHLYDVSAPGESGYVRGSGRRGIFVGGKFEGEIVVDFNYVAADMIARSFRGNVTIGQMFQGALVAVGHETPTDSLDGTIYGVSIGNNGLARSAGPEPHGHGFNGKLDAPLHLHPWACPLR